MNAPTKLEPQIGYREPDCTNEKVRAEEMIFYKHLAPDLQLSAVPTPVPVPAPIPTSSPAIKSRPQQKLHHAQQHESHLPYAFKPSGSTYVIPSLLEFPMCKRNPYSQYNFGGLSENSKGTTPTTTSSTKS